MTSGVIAPLAELLALQRCAQTVHYRSAHVATRIGHHRSKVRGRGMDFSEARNYQAGDEIRHMEWRATARTGRPHVKVYHEERERPVVILVDFNPSMYFGTRQAFKSVIAARLASILAWTATKQGDRLGGVIFSSQSHHEFMPRSRKSGVLPFISALSQYTYQYAIQHDLSSYSPHAFNHALLRLRRVVKPGSIVVLISDFYATDIESEQHLSRLSSHNDVLAYHICDPLELNPPKPQQYAMTDGKKSILLDTSLDAVRFSYQFFCDERLNNLQAQFRRLKIQSTQILPETDLALMVKLTFPRRIGG